MARPVREAVTSFVASESRESHSRSAFAWKFHFLKDLSPCVLLFSARKAKVAVVADRS